MTKEEHFLLTKVTDNRSEIRDAVSPLCYELKLVPPVLYPSRSLILRFKNYYVTEISVKAIFERDDKTIDVLLIDEHPLMPNCHTEQGSSDIFDISIDLPESSLSLSRLLVFCYQPSQNWSVWRLDDVSLFSITQSDRKSETRDKACEHSNDTIKLIRSLTSVLQDNIALLQRREELGTNSQHVTPPITGPYYNIQLLLSHQ